MQILLFSASRPRQRSCMVPHRLPQCHHISLGSSLCTQLPLLLLIPLLPCLANCPVCSSPGKFAPSSSPLRSLPWPSLLIHHFTVSAPAESCVNEFSQISLILFLTTGSWRDSSSLAPGKGWLGTLYLLRIETKLVWSLCFFLFFCLLFFFFFFETGSHYVAHIGLKLTM
jgi:hypothetical protein